MREGGQKEGGGKVKGRGRTRRQEGKKVVRRMQAMKQIVSLLVFWQEEHQGKESRRKDKGGEERRREKGGEGNGQAKGRWAKGKREGVRQTRRAGGRKNEDQGGREEGYLSQL
jgi:hypothetical protein